MHLDEALLLFQEYFQVFSQRPKPHAVRLIAPPYTDEESDSRLVYSDGKDPATLHCESILSALEKFKITEDDFRSAYNEFYRGKRNAKIG